MGNLLKAGAGRIFESCDISLENMPTSHAASLALFMHLLREKHPLHSKQLGNDWYNDYQLRSLQ